MNIYLKNYKRAKFRYQTMNNRYIENYFEQLYFLLGLTSVCLNYNSSNTG